MLSLYSLLITKSMYIAMLLTSFIAKARFLMIWYCLTCLMDEVWLFCSNTKILLDRIEVKVLKKGLFLVY